MNFLLHHGVDVLYSRRSSGCVAQHLRAVRESYMKQSEACACPRSVHGAVQFVSQPAVVPARDSQRQWS